MLRRHMLRKNLKSTFETISKLTVHSQFLQNNLNLTGKCPNFGQLPLNIVLGECIAYYVLLITVETI